MSAGLLLMNAMAIVLLIICGIKQIIPIKVEIADKTTWRKNSPWLGLTTIALSLLMSAYIAWELGWYLIPGLGLSN